MADEMTPDEERQVQAAIDEFRAEAQTRLDRLWGLVNGVNNPVQRKML